MDTKIDQVCKLKEDGLSLQDIATEVGFSKSSVKRILAKQEALSRPKPPLHWHPDMNSNRYPREGDSRDNFDRGSEFREVDFMDRKGSLYVDPEVAPDGYTLGWIVTDWSGKPKPSFLMSAMNRGWVPIKAAEHYSLNRNLSHRAIVQDVFKTTTDEYVREGGQILCKRPTEMHEREQNVYNKRQNDRRNVGREEGLVTHKDDPTYGPVDYTPVRPRSNIF